MVATGVAPLVGVLVGCEGCVVLIGGGALVGVLVGHSRGVVLLEGLPGGVAPFVEVLAGRGGALRITFLLRFVLDRTKQLSIAALPFRRAQGSDLVAPIISSSIL